MYYETLPGFPFCRELLESNHILIGGATGCGKSVVLSDLLYTITSYHPEDKQIFIIDLKRISLIKWKQFPHVIKYIQDKELVIPTLECIYRIMMNRYKYMEDNEQDFYPGSAVYLVIDELPQIIGIRERIDKSTVKTVVDILTSLLQLARAANIHIIAASQNMSRCGVPSALQQNFDCRIGLHCATALESRQAINKSGCEYLPKYGQAIILCDGFYKRIQVPMLSNDQIEERKLYYAS